MLRPGPTLMLALGSAVVLGTGGTAALAARGSDSPPNVPLEVERKAGAPCPPGTLPDGPLCVHLPASPFDLPELTAAEASHRDRRGNFQIYEQVPRRPERPADYEAYRYPIPPGLAGGKHVISGYDLDQPDEAQRRGPRLRAVGHGGLDLPQLKGTPVKLVALESQQGDAEVVYAGPLFGTTVVTRHTLREGGRLRDYLVLFGHLERAAPLAPGARVAEGDVIGTVGDTGSPELVHLHLETRRVREGVDCMKVSPPRLLDSSVSVVTDPRNVLPRRQD